LIKQEKRGCVAESLCYDEIVDCYKFMSDTVDYIAISFDYSYYISTGLGKTNLERYCSGRQFLISDLISDGYWCWSKPHHLLGCSLAREFRYYIQNNVNNIRTLDTSNPVVAGSLGYRYNGDLGLNHKPKQLLADMIEAEISEDQKEDIIYNILQFKKIVVS